MNVFQFFSQNFPDVLLRTSEHLFLALLATLIAALIAIPVGIVLTRRPVWSKPVIGFAGVLQTIPSLALFGFLIPLPLLGGTNKKTAIIALVLYALLPILRNTFTGIQGVDSNVTEAGRGMGMTDRQLLLQVQLPLASSVIFAGIRIAMVLSIGIATIAAYIGAGGLGTYIFRGISTLDNTLILAGAIPAALLAIFADAVLGAVQRRFEQPRREPESSAR
jgi:osmoprotectant transport system permease protein